MITLTVFTPTYNRAHTLKRLYTSLCRQTCRDFEWLVIDDGSTDDTRSLVQGFVQEGKIPVRYIFKENGGLYTGYNMAYAAIETELNVCIDSDDYMPDNAVELIVKSWAEHGGERYAGITGLDFYAGTDRPIAGYFPDGLKECHLLDLYIGGIHRGDSKQVMRTDIVTRFAPMEGFPGEKNFNPVYMLLQAADDLPMLLLNENLCFVDYAQSDSMSASIYRQYMDSPRSFAKQRLMEMGLKRSTFRNNVRLMIHYVASCIIARDKDWLRNTHHKLLAVVCAVPGYMLYRYIMYKNLHVVR